MRVSHKYFDITIYNTYNYNNKFNKNIKVKDNNKIDFCVKKTENIKSICEIKVIISKGLSWLQIFLFIS